ncbi:phage tail tube protein [Actinophytocola sp. NPDC049390]|uniref:phage tail tube protein n=1 Tax=Actinophytocola sp. NPDC049390 TaxID=3363894 RepID=UPI00378F88D9
MAVSDKAQLGAKTETTYGTSAAPVDKFFDFVSESAAFEQTRIESSSLRAQSRVITTDNWALGSQSVSGDFDMELRPKGQAFWLAHAIGTAVTSQPDAAGNPTVYLHTITPAALPQSFTLQIAKPDIADTAHPFTYTGCRVSDWELTCEVDSFAHLKLSFLGQAESTATALAVASYPTGNKPYTFVQGTITVAGSAAKVKSLSLQGANNLTDDRVFLGSTLRDRPEENALREYTGSLEAEFNGLTQYNRFVQGTEAEVVLLFEGATISSTYKYQCKITMNVRFDGETPKVGGPEIVQAPMPYKVINNGTTSIKVEYQTTDTTAA